MVPIQPRFGKPSGAIRDARDGIALGDGKGRRPLWRPYFPHMRNMVRNFTKVATEFHAK